MTPEHTIRTAAILFGTLSAKSSESAAAPQAAYGMLLPFTMAHNSRRGKRSRGSVDQVVVRSFSKPKNTIVTSRVVSTLLAEGWEIKLIAVKRQENGRFQFV